MGTDQLSAINAQKAEVVDNLNSQKEGQKREVQSKFNQQREQATAQMEAAIGDIEGRINMMNARISELEAVLNSLPVNHPERKKIEKQISSIKKQVALLRAKRVAMKLRKSSTAALFKFRSREQVKMIEIKYAQQKSMVLKQFAEKVMEVKQQMLVQREMMARQKAMNNAQQNNESTAAAMG